MSWTEFFIIFACCALTILACRVIPLFLLKGKEFPERVSDALGFIPPAAFAALIGNDLLSPNMFDAGIWPAAAPLLASIFVVLVAVKTRSLLWCAIVGVIVYALLAFLSGTLW